MPTIHELVTARDIAAYITNNPSNNIDYLGARLFPPDKQIGLDLSWIKGSQGLPVALMPSEFDTKATLRDRIGFDRVETEMPFFRESMRIGEKDRQQLNQTLATNNSAYYDSILRKIYDDVSGLVNGAQVNPERMIMQLLSTGNIAIVANRIKYTYDYKFKSSHRLTLAGASKWSETETADVIGDIMDSQQQVEDDTGNRPINAICTRKTWGYIMKNKAIRLDMNPIGGQNIIMTDSKMKEYLLDKLGIRVEVYNKKYALQDGTTHQFFPDNVFTLIPEGRLGTTWYGTTPEESDLLSGGTDAKVEIVNTGVAVTTIKEPHPVNVETIVSAIQLPSFERIDDIYIIEVA